MSGILADIAYRLLATPPRSPVLGEGPGCVAATRAAARWHYVRVGRESGGRPEARTSHRRRPASCQGRGQSHDCP
ncbi:hypothetical protein [Nocardia asiatica]|uniref:hypothetical protein n=1 Tax=Nocardia asiatica TaxID=209252 RepID=UPI003EE1198A